MKLISIPANPVPDNAVTGMLKTPDGVALRFARYVNGVAMRHGEVSREMFPDYKIDAITNGVHAATWTAPAFRDQKW